MRAQLKTPMRGSLSCDHVSLSQPIKYYDPSLTGFPGGMSFYSFSNTRLSDECVRHAGLT
jgi:hypothetical protein